MTTRPDPGAPPPPRRDGGGAGDAMPPEVDDLVVDDVAARLLGEPRSMRRRQVSAGAEVSLLSARKFWHALGFPNVGDEDTVFTDADLQALRSVVGMVREGVFDESSALSMIRALGRTTDRLAGWQTQLMAEALGDAPAVDAWTGSVGEGGASPDTSRAVPDRDSPCRRPEADRARRPARAAAGLRVAPAPDRGHLPHGRGRRAGEGPHRGGPQRRLRRPRVVHRAGTATVRAPARPGRAAVRGAGLRRRHRPRRPGRSRRSGTRCCS